MGFSGYIIKIDFQNCSEISVMVIKAIIVSTVSITINEITHMKLTTDRRSTSWKRETIMIQLLQKRAKMNAARIKFYKKKSKYPKQVLDQSNMNTLRIAQQPLLPTSVESEIAPNYSLDN